MNKYTMVIWGLIIFMLWGLILLIAYTKQDKTYIDLTADLKSVTRRYMNKNNIDLKFNESYKVFIEDLEKDNLIIDDSKIEEYCIDGIVITKNLFNYSYQFDKKCDNKE